VLDLLVRDEANPRSVAFQLIGLRDYLRRVAELFGEPADEQLDAAVEALAALDPGADLLPDSPRLAALLDEWSAAAARLSEQIGLRFFSLVGQVSRQTFAT
jgi:uncharacterized alpha-E superfamily protein